MASSTTNPPAAPARAHSSYAIRTLIREKLGAVSYKIRQVFQVRSGWAVQTADPETRDFLVQKQAEWAAELGATIVETNKEWFTYVVSDIPRRLTDFHGNEVDSDSIVSDEIEIQTGLKPVNVCPRQISDNSLTKTLLGSLLKPTRKYWSLFDSRAARLIDKTDRLRLFSNVSAVIESLCDVNVNLARLNDLSQSVAIAGIASISRANWLTIGNCLGTPQPPQSPFAAHRPAACSGTSGQGSQRVQFWRPSPTQVQYISVAAHTSGPGVRRSHLYAEASVEVLETLSFEDTLSEITVPARPSISNSRTTRESVMARLVLALAVKKVSSNRHDSVPIGRGPQVKPEMEFGEGI
ncbi:hypothetical protein MRS44_017242 [Fusarium solani]|uniref:uncharacterized protein n=1 Tax=Fusarium solani TaxID=169388 RepID=UPI0032C452BE|nr:hypothetical protein MRS44_017242 [Fusarium solani]